MSWSSLVKIRSDERLIKARVTHPSISMTPTCFVWKLSSEKRLFSLQSLSYLWNTRSRPHLYKYVESIYYVSQFHQNEKTLEIIVILISYYCAKQNFLFNQFVHKRCRHRLDMGGQSLPPPISTYLSEISTQAIYNPQKITLIKTFNRSSDRRKSRNLN